MERITKPVEYVAIVTATAITAYFNTTYTYVVALLIGFAFNIIAGFRADEVRIKLQRIIPPVFFVNFNGNKLKDSLLELFLIFSITYILKLLVDLLDFDESSSYVVRALLGLAVYYYFRNSLRNLKKVYPQNRWIRLLYNLIAFKMRAIFGTEMADIIDKDEKDEKDTN